MILSKQKCCLLLTGVSRESQQRTSLLQTKRVLSNKKYDSYTCWTCAELCRAFTFLMENIYVQFEGMLYQQIVGILMGTNCAPLIADLFLFCYERDFMSNLHKLKRYDLIDMFNDTSRYLDDIFTIKNGKLLAVMFRPAFTTNAMTSDFLSSISPGWVVMVLDSHLMVFKFLSWLDLLSVSLAFRISILKIFNLLPNY